MGGGERQAEVEEAQLKTTVMAHVGCQEEKGCQGAWKSQEGKHHPLYSPMKTVSYKESGSFSNTSLYWGPGDPTPKLIFSSLKLHHRSPLLNDEWHSGDPIPNIFLVSVGNPSPRKPPLLEDFVWEKRDPAAVEL